MNELIYYILVLGGLFCLACFWIVYLIKIVLNDEMVKERLLRIERMMEEKRRAREDAIRQKQEQSRMATERAQLMRQQRKQQIEEKERRKNEAKEAEKHKK